MASKRITQETFDAVVKENMEDFELGAEEAIADAIQQFESQGINLTNIIKEAHVGGGSGEPTKHPVVVALDGLAEGIKTIASGGDGAELLEDIISHLQAFKTECDKDLAHKMQAASNEAFPTLLLLTQSRLAKADEQFQCKALESLCSLLNGQPDLMTVAGMDFLLESVRTLVSSEGDSHPSSLALLIKAIRFSCIKHETNRQAYVKKDLIKTLIIVLGNAKGDVKVIREVDATFRALVVDDDVRVPFGKAHDHAKLIVESGALKILLEVMQSCMHDQAAVGDLSSTLGRLSVRNEFCQEIVNLGGLKSVLKVLGDDLASQIVVRQLLELLKAIAGNDEVKIAIVNAGGIPTILGAMSRYIRAPQLGIKGGMVLWGNDLVGDQVMPDVSADPVNDDKIEKLVEEMPDEFSCVITRTRPKGIKNVCLAGCAAVAAIVLRKPANCLAVMEAEGAKLLVHILTIHKDEAAVQKQACRAVRNLVARTPEHNDPFIQLGIESLLRDAEKHCPDDAKAALRDLHLKVELRELWKGEKNPLTN